MDKTRNQKGDQDYRVVIEVEEPARGKALMMMKKIVIPPRYHAEFELECDEFEIRPEPFLQQKRTKPVDGQLCNVQCFR